ncbi:MAG TPA: phosphate/phosphite/phosphonate ABC transporter substrate-binding protein [Candidatus Limnocylindrales bacterium]|nr:phosphate/phosphite/phosphonate ABC transporter substrate-binding protein [Candidatus Limnocylindrales bacterium]
MRFSVRGPLGWALAAGLLVAACGGTPATTASQAPSGAAASNGPRIGSFDRPVSLAFTPSQESATIATNGAAIKAALEKATGLAWKVTTMTSYAAQVEGMCSGSIDVGFFAPLQMTLLLGKACGTPVLGALRKDDTGQLATTYKSQILVRNDSGINSLTDLKGKKFAFVDPLSASGYVYPTLAIKNKTGQEPKTFFSQTIFAGGHPQAALAVFNKQVDAAAMFIDARDSLVAANPSIKTDTKVIDTAGPIPNDGVALRKGFPDDVGKTVTQALIDYSKDAAGAKVFSALFQWDGIQPIDAKFYDPMKEAAALAGVNVEDLAKNTPRPAATPSPAPSKTP